MCGCKVWSRARNCCPFPIWPRRLRPCRADFPGGGAFEPGGMDRLQRQLHTNMQEALALEVGLLKTAVIAFSCRLCLQNNHRAPTVPKPGLPIFAFVAGLFFFLAIISMVDRTSLTFLRAAVDLAGMGVGGFSATQTVSPGRLTKLTSRTLPCASASFIWAFSPGRGCRIPGRFGREWVWRLCWAMRAGWSSTSGGLRPPEKCSRSRPNYWGWTRKMLADPDYLKRIASNRIFGTFGGYPNRWREGLCFCCR
jgi:hypothetical protein